MRNFAHGEYISLQYEIDKYTWNRYSNNAVGFLVIPLTILFAVGVMRVLTGGDPLTFTGLLTLLENAPTIPMDWIGVISLNWGETFPYGFQWFGSFVDFIVSCFAGTIWSVTALVNVLTFILYFIPMFFAGAY